VVERGIMYLDILIAQRHWTKYQLSKISQIPYTTLNDLFNEKTSLLKSSSETLYKLSKVLNLSMEDLIKKDIYAQKTIERIDPELFRSNVQHRLKSLGSRSFIKQTLIEDTIAIYHEKNWMFEALYILASLDYLCRLEGLPKASKYTPLRSLHLDEIYYPSSLILMSKMSQDGSILLSHFSQSIPEFKQFNIVESDLVSVV